MTPEQTTKALEDLRQILRNILELDALLGLDCKAGKPLEGVIGRADFAGIVLASKQEYVEGMPTKHLIPNLHALALSSLCLERARGDRSTADSA